MLFETDDMIVYRKPGVDVKLAYASDDIAFLPKNQQAKGPPRKKEKAGSTSRKGGDNASGAANIPRIYPISTAMPKSASAPAKGEGVAKPSVEIKQIERELYVGTVFGSRPNLWLRDVCPCEKCVDPHSGQKKFATTQLDFLPDIKSAERADDGSLTVVWANDPVSNGEDHTSVYPPSIRDGFTKFLRRDLWDRATYEEGRETCRVSYSDWMAGGSEFWAAMAALSSKGLIFVHGLPEGDESAVERVGEQIGALQETFYGRTWDVVSKPRAENVAYTNQFLGLHQDLLYYPDPPRIQLLHCLANECDGGESIFSDGVHAAALIQLVRPATFEALADHPTAYHYDKNGNVYYAERPVVKSKAKTLNTAIDNVWWSPPFQAPYPIDSHKMAPWFLAARQFQAEIERPEHVVQHRLQPGECVVFDNWRVLHGRREFSSSTGRRHLKGTYVDDATFRRRYEDMPAAAAAEHRPYRNRTDEFKANKKAALHAGRSRKMAFLEERPAADIILHRARARGGDRPTLPRLGWLTNQPEETVAELSKKLSPGEPRSSASGGEQVGGEGEQQLQEKPEQVEIDGTQQPEEKPASSSEGEHLEGQGEQQTEDKPASS